jgi:ribonuclease P protein component
MALPQRHRLRGQRPFLALRWLPARPDLLPRSQRAHAPSAWRAGVVVSTKVHKRAVQRNRLRRLLHRLLVSLPIAGPDRAVWLLISLKPGSAERDSSELLGECQHLLQRAGLTP